jgi:polyisoprenoid-binding protein YceI
MSTWKIDHAHSHIEFKIKHLVVTTLGGHFNKFDATAETSNDDFTDAKITFEADIDSITTGNEQRDGHLKSDDFFNAATYPKLTFVSTSLKKIDTENYKLTGNLTIRDKTLPVSLDVVYGGTTKNAYGHTIAGFELNGKINRKDFGLKWSFTTEAGNVVVSDEVRLVIGVEMVKQD